MAGDRKYLSVADVDAIFGKYHAMLFGLAESARCHGCEIGHDVAAYAHDQFCNARRELKGEPPLPKEEAAPTPRWPEKATA